MGVVKVGGALAKQLSGGGRLRTDGACGGVVAGRWYGRSRHRRNKSQALEENTTLENKVK